MKLFMVAATLVVLLLVAVMGGVAYVAYRAKQKVDRIQQAFKDNDVEKIANELKLKDVVAKIAPGAAQGLSTDNSADTIADAGTWKPYTGLPASAATKLVPLKSSLATVEATSQKGRPDYETIITVQGVSTAGVNLDFVYLGPPQQAAGSHTSSAPSTIRNNVTERTVLSEDLASAHEIHIYYSHQDPRTFPGTTSGSLSREVFNELKTSEGVPFKYRATQPATVEGAISNLMGKIQNADSNSPMSIQDLVPGMSLTEIDCTLQRAAPADIAFPVLLNDKPVEIPALSAVCKSNQDELRLYVLDEPEYPIILAGSSRFAHFHSQIIRISYAEDTPRNQIEQDLKQSGRAQVYGIYFDFASATLRPQSKPVLEEIARAMKDNPTWKLSVEGHTDNIGDDPSNLELSQQRSGAVVKALTTQYHIPTDRFTTVGFGASRPVDTNDTMEGRARNRRVELVRQ
jgi:OOP family OmpA-OmpF porin